MKKIQYAIARKETGNASGKAKRDAFDIALRMGFSPSYYPSSKQAIRVIQQIFTLPRFIGDKIIFFQYPAVSERLMRMFKNITSSASYKIALIHDLSSIQGLIEQERDREADLLNIFDCIIVHNCRMKEYVEEIGYKNKIIILEIFDYLHDADHSIQAQPFSNSVSFAGNLKKAKFLQEIGKINCNWLLYGVKGEDDYSLNQNIKYKGSLPSDEIQYLMEGDYGLVWDGDSIDSCSGPHGEYLKYNNPHKLSCYIAAGKPIITWKQAAIADFISKNNIGIVVNSLEELNCLDLKNNYEEMKNNVLRIKKMIANGQYLENAIRESTNEV